MKRYALSLINNKPFIEQAQTHYDRVLLKDCQFQKLWQKYTGWGNYKPALNWDRAFTITFAGNNGVVIPIQYNAGNSILAGAYSSSVYVPSVHLLISKDYKDTFNAEIVTLVPDGIHRSNFANSFSGVILPGNCPVNTLRNIPSPILKKAYSCSGHVPHNIPNFKSESAPESEKERPSGPSTLSTTFSVTSGDNIIGNIIDYLKCFDNIPGNDHTYQIKLCVIQPNPGKRDPWAFSNSDRKKATQNPVFVGHTFLILSAITPIKTTVRNVGFYPTETVHPYSPVSQGILNNDQAHEYDVLLTISLTNSQFFNVLNYLPKGNNKGFNYNLNTNNCSTFAVDALAAGQIVIPRTIGKWTNGSGMNPGDLGEDLRSMALLSNMTLKTTFSHHPNLGDCQ